MTQENKGFLSKPIPLPVNSNEFILKERAFRNQRALEDGMTQEEFDKLEVMRSLKQKPLTNIQALFELNRLKYQRGK